MKIISNVIFFIYSTNNLYILLNKNNIPFIYLNEYTPLYESTNNIINNITNVYNGVKQVKTYQINNTIHILYYTIIKEPDILIDYTKINILQLSKNYKLIINDALNMLKHDILTSTVGLKMLPEYFPFKDVHALYETILNIKLNRANFRTKFLSFNILKETSILEESVSHRPAKMFTINNDNTFKLNL